MLSAEAIEGPLWRAEVIRCTPLFARECGVWKPRHMHASNMLAADLPR